MNAHSDWIYVYLSFQDGPPAKLELWLDKVLGANNYDLTKGNLSEVVILGGRGALIDFRASIPAIVQDLNTHYKALVVPVFSKLFEPYVKTVKTDSFDYLINCISGDEIFKKAQGLIANVDPQILRTALYFFEFANSPQATAEFLYMHRNTVNYRLQKFIATTRFDITEAPNAMFIYRLINYRIKNNDWRSYEEI